MIKAEAREYVLTERKCIDFQLLSKQVIKKIVEENILWNKEKIGLYYPLKWEINLLDLLNIYPHKKFYFPAIHYKMEFKIFDSLTSFIPGPFHTMQPMTEIVDINEIDLIFIPCLATSKTKQRLGYGKGYYDRALESYQGVKIGICPSVFQNLDVEMEHHDIVLDFIIKE